MFQHKDELYSQSYDSGGVEIVLSGRKILLPDMPPESEMVNYNLKTKDQKMIRRHVPTDMAYWDKRDLDYFVEAEWHRRKHGYWVLVKGKPFFVPGPYDTFFNNWEIELGGKAEFRMSQLEWFQFWFSVENDPGCFGMLDIKPRRVGDTEAAVFTVWERTTRGRRNNGGIVHINEDGALKNFRRLVNGNSGMPFWFKPYNDGTDKPKGGILEFDIPAERITAKKIRDGGFHEDGASGLGSKIWVEPAVTGVFDGDRLTTYYSDEIFKVKSNKFDIIKQWKNMKRVLSLNNGQKIIGKGIKTSTVEEMEDGGTVEIARKLIDDSTTYGPDGRTLSGLAFMFRSWRDSSDVDEWGFHKIKEAKKIRDAKIAMFTKEKKWDDLLDIYRKEPDTVDEALSAPLGECILYPERCEQRLLQLKNGIDVNGQPQEQPGEYGDLHWVGGIFGGRVEWRPGGTKKWFISQHPIAPNNKMIIGGKPYPGNMGHYRMGMDPYESGEVEGKGSDGAFTVKRLLNLAYEQKEIKINPETNRPVNTWDLTTGQYVCDYKARPDNPFDFFEDAYKTCVYYGVAAYPETTKPGFRNWMVANNLEHYVQLQPAELKAQSSRLKGVRGGPATTQSINQYITSLQAFIYDFIWCCNHPRIIKDWKIFTKKTRTLRDMSVATGYTELAEFDSRAYEENDDRKDDGWDYPFERNYE